MPDASRSRTIAMPAQELWEVINDPHHLPRWWPRVTRVEDVVDGAFTEVMKTRKGKLVRADFKVVACDQAAHSLTWAQQIEGTPFARVLKSAETTVQLSSARASAPPSRRGETDETDVPEAQRAREAWGARETPGARDTSYVPDASGRGATVVRIELRQTMAGYSSNVGLFTGFSARFGSPMVRHAARATIDEALDGLERIGG